MGENSKFTGEALKVFISYSRNDAAFADQIVDLIRSWGYSPLIDRHSIGPAEEWGTRLGALILEADAVVFIHTSSSARSTICAWEIEEAARLKKKIVPILPARTAAVLHPELAALNLIFFYSEQNVPGSSYKDGSNKLASALNTDWQLVRAHTRILVKASEWDLTNRSAESLLRGQSLNQAEGLIARLPPSLELHELVVEYVTASAEAELARKDSEARDLEERQKTLAREEKAIRRVQRITGIAVFAVSFVGILAIWGGWIAVRTSIDASSKRAQVFAQQAQSIAQVSPNKSEDRILMALYANVGLRSDLLGNWMNSKIDFSVPRATLTSAITHRHLVKILRPPGPATHHANTIVSFSADMRNAYTHQRFRSCNFWIRSNGWTRQEFDRQTPSLGCLSVSGDGRYALSPEAEGNVVHWNLETGEEIVRLVGHRLTPGVAAYGPHGRLALTGSDDGTAKLWDLHTGDILMSLEGDDDWVRAVAISSDGQRALTGGFRGGGAKLWDLQTGEIMIVLDDLGGPTVNAVAFSPDGKRALTASDETATLWDLNSGEILKVLAGHGNSEALGNDVLAVAFSPDGRFALTGAEDNTARLWRLYSGHTLITLDGHEKPVTSVAFGSDGQHVLTGSDDQTARIWKIHSNVPSSQLWSESDRVYALAVSQDGQRVIVGEDNGVFNIWSANDNELVASIDSDMRYSTPISISPDGKRALTSQIYSETKLWSLETGNVLATLGSAEEDHSAIEFSSDGRKALTVSPGSIAKLWDLNDLEVMTTVNGQIEPAFLPEESITFDVALSPDNSRAVIGHELGATIWDLEVGEFISALNGPPVASWIRSVSISPDGQYVLTGSDDDIVKVWSLETGNLITTLNGIRGDLHDVEFSPNGLGAITTSFYSTKIWDLKTGIALITFELLDESTSAAAPHPDNRRIFTGSSNGYFSTVKIWDIPEIVWTTHSRQIEIACQTLRDMDAPLAFSDSDIQRYPILSDEPRDPTDPSMLWSPCSESNSRAPTALQNGAWQPSERL